MYILSVSKKVISLRYNIVGGVSKASSLSLFIRDKALKLKIIHRNRNKVLKYFKGMTNIRSLHLV